MRLVLGESSDGSSLGHAASSDGPGACLSTSSAPKAMVLYAAGAVTTGVAAAPRGLRLSTGFPPPNMMAFEMPCAFFIVRLFAVGVKLRPMRSLGA